MREVVPFELKNPSSTRQKLVAACHPNLIFIFHEIFYGYFVTESPFT